MILFSFWLKTLILYLWDKAEIILSVFQSETMRVTCLNDSLEKQCSVFQTSLDQIRSTVQVLVEETMPEVRAIVTFDTISHYVGKWHLHSWSLHSWSLPLNTQFSHFNIAFVTSSLPQASLRRLSPVCWPVPQKSRMIRKLCNLRTCPCLSPIYCQVWNSWPFTPTMKQCITSLA